MERGCSRVRLHWMLKMTAVATCALLLLCCSGVHSADSPAVCDIYGVTGGSFTVPLNFNLPPAHNLKWKHDNTKIFDRRSDGRYVAGVKGDVSENGSLMLRNLRKDQTGKYMPEIFTNDGKSIGKDLGIQLCIQDPVPKLRLKVECLGSRVRFSCIAGQTQGEYTWTQNEKVVAKESKATLIREADVLYGQSIKCKVSNRVSSSSSEPLVEECSRKKLFGFDFWIMVGILAGGGGLVLVLIIVLIVCCVRAKRKKSLKIKDEEELRLQWTKPDQHPQHKAPPKCHQHRGRQQHPAGHTGPRQPRGKQPQQPRNPQHPRGQAQPRRPVQGSRPAGRAAEEKPPPLPQPRKTASKPQRV